VRAFGYLLLVSLFLVLIISGCGGSAVPSSPSSPPSPPGPNPLPSAPSPPQNLVGIAGDQEVDLQWQPPASTGGSPITHYTVYRNGKAVATTNYTTYSDRGLTNGVEYQYYVTASNSIGESPPSNVIRVTPNAPAPQISLSVYYPTITDPADARLTGSGTLFTILGKLDVIGGYQSQYTLQALDTDGTLLQSWKVSPGDFRVDLSNFGSPGDKNIILRIAESPLSTAQVPVIVDDSRLQQRAQELIAQGLSGWLTTHIQVYVPESLRSFVSLFEKACSFWATYTSFRFQVLIGKPEEQQGYIKIVDSTDEASWMAADSGFNFDAYNTVTSAAVEVYQGWAQTADWMKAFIIAHELFHCLFGAVREGEYYGEFGSRFVGNQRSGPFSLDQSIIPPLVQKAAQILNSRRSHR